MTSGFGFRAEDFCPGHTGKTEDGESIMSYEICTGADSFLVCETVSSPGDKLLPYTLPQAEYMDGCSATSAGMLLGYYDLYGYTVNDKTYELSNLIEGTISVNSRGSDGGSIYDMSDPSVLCQFIASEGYISRFYGKTAEAELPYTFVNSDPAQGLNVSAWDSLADYLGTGQYWRQNGDLSTTTYTGLLSTIEGTSQEYEIDTLSASIRFSDLKYGLSLLVESKGYSLDADATFTRNKGDFTFQNYKAEIDAGRPVLISIRTAGNAGHMVVGYGYNEENSTIIFDDTYRSDCRMTWNGTYEYADDYFSISSFTTIVFDVSSSSPEPEPIEPEPIEPDPIEPDPIEPAPPSPPTPPAPAPEPEPEPTPVGPAAPKVSADITVATAGNVTVSASFGRDAITKQYSLNGGRTWQDYTDGIVMTDNGSVWFRAGNDDGWSEVVEYVVSNIDRVPPVKPVASADIKGSTTQNVTVTAVFSEDTALRQYSYDNLVWNTYTSGIVFSRNGSVYFRGIDAVGNISDVTQFTVGNIQSDRYEIAGDQNSSKTVKLDVSGKYILTGSFGKDVSGTVTLLNGKKKIGTGTIKNGVLTFNKGKSVLLDSDLETVVQVTIRKGTATAYDLHLDAESVFPEYDPAGSDPKSALNLGTALAAGQTLVPNGWVGYGDETDYYAVTLDSGAKFSVTCTSNDALKYTLFNASTGKSVQSASLSGKGTVTAKEKLLDAGKYYLAVQSTNAKKGGSADYSVSVSKDTVFYTKGDNSDDWKDMKTKGGKSGAVDKTTVGTLTSSSTKLITDWVGFSDAADYKAFTLESAAKLVFDVSATDAAKFTVYQLVETKVGYKLTAKLPSTTIAAPKKGAKLTAVTTKEVQLTAGTYYIAVESTNAAKGGSADYTVSVNQKGSKFYPAGDNSNDTWQAAKKSSAIAAGETVTGWVGFSDAADFIKFQANNGQIKLDLDKDTAKALSSKEIKLSCLDAKGRSVALTSLDSDTLVSKAVLAGEYYLGVTCANVKKFDTSYSITTGMRAS